MKRSRCVVGLVVAAPILLGGFWLVSNSRAATEMPAYQLVRADGVFEIRDYPALTVATTPMESGAMNGSFGQLFRFITGANAGAEKIAMTAPVLIDSADERRTMSFIMPRDTVAKGVPAPKGGPVTLRHLEAARFATLRFRGRRSAENEKAAREKLVSWMAAQNLAGQGEPIFAYYDPPWTPLFLRRNEVMIRCAK